LSEAFDRIFHWQGEIRGREDEKRAFSRWDWPIYIVTSF
jgi:hypothetical protein